jgi:hypothetical protein
MGYVGNFSKTFSFSWFSQQCSSVDTGSPVYCNNKAEYKTSIKQTEREGRVKANRRAELTLLFFAESAWIYTEREWTTRATRAYHGDPRNHAKVVALCILQIEI